MKMPGRALFRSRLSLHTEFAAASGAMDFLFTRSPVQPKQHPALRASEILVLLHSFHAPEKLFCLQRSIPEEEQKPVVFFLPFIFIPGKEAEKEQAVQPVTDINQPGKPGQGNGNLYHKTGKQQRRPEVVRAVAGRHEAGEPEQHLSDKIHGISPLFSGITDIYHTFSHDKLQTVLSGRAEKQRHRFLRYCPRSFTERKNMNLKVKNML